MKATYLLPCSCGRKIPVDRSQAGQQIQCECGAQLEIPTMQALRSLQRADPKPTDRPPPARSAWGARQRLLLLGAVITVAALGLSARVYYSRPRLPDVDELSPIRTWLLWQQLRQGVQERPLGEKQFLEQVKVYHRWMGVLVVITGAGVLIMAGSVLLPNRRPARTIRPPGPGNRAPG